MVLYDKFNKQELDYILIILKYRVKQLKQYKGTFKIAKYITGLNIKLLTNLIDNISNHNKITKDDLVIISTSFDKTIGFYWQQDDIKWDTECDFITSNNIKDLQVLHNKIEKLFGFSITQY